MLLLKKATQSEWVHIEEKLNLIEDNKLEKKDPELQKLVAELGS